MANKEKVAYLSDLDRELGELADVARTGSYEDLKDKPETVRPSTDDDAKGKAADAKAVGEELEKKANKDLVPEGTNSSTNMLVNQAELNKAIQTYSAHYRGYFETWHDVPDDPGLYAADSEGNHEPSPNDYIAVGDMSDYLDGDDSSGSSSPDGEYIGAWRMTYSGLWEAQKKNGWKPAFRYNESPLSKEQQDAIDSGITSEKVSKLDSLPDVNTLTLALSEKRDLTDLSVDPDKWLLVKPDGTQVWLAADTSSIGMWTGAGFELLLNKSGTWSLSGDSLNLETAAPADAASLEFSSGSSAYRLVRGSRLALDTEIPSAQVNADWNATSGVAQILNKPTIPPAVTVDDTVTRTSANPVKSSGIWSAIWGALAALPHGFASLYDWCVVQLSGKRGKTDLAVYTMSDWHNGSASTEVAFRYDEASGEWIGEPDIIYAEGHRLRYNAAEGEWQYVLSSGDVIGLSADEGAMELRPAGYLISRSSVYVETSDKLAQTSQLAQKQDALSGQQLGYIAAVPGKADAADLRYRIAEAVKVRTGWEVPDAWFPIGFTFNGTAYSIPLSNKGDVSLRQSIGNQMYLTCLADNVSIDVANFDDGVFSSEMLDVDGTLTFNNMRPVAGITSLDPVYAYTVADRTVNLITVDDEMSVDIAFPKPQQGYSRDFYLAVTCGSTAPTLNTPTGVALLNAKGEPASLTLVSNSTTVLRFREVKEADQSASAVFCVTGGENGSGTPVPPSTDSDAAGKPADAKATGDFILSKLEFDPEDSGYEVGQIVLYEGKLYRCVHFHSGPWVPGNFRETSIGDEINYLTFFKYTKPNDGIPETDLARAVQTALSAIPGKADSADLRYRIAETVAGGKTLPANCFPVTLIYDGVSYSVNSLVEESEASAVGDMFLSVFDNIYSLGMVVTAGSEDEKPEVIEVATFHADGVYESGTAGLQFGDVGEPIADTSPTLADVLVLADRMVNLFTATTETSIAIEFPVVQVGYSRDFYLAVTCGSTAPTLNAPSGVTLVNAKGEQPDLSLTPSATTVLRFTEVKEAGQSTSAVFCVTGGANGGGSLDLSVLVDEFSEQATYEVGDIVQYQGELYMCEVAVETPGEWDSSDWTTAEPVLSSLMQVICGKADSSDLDSKADSTALAPEWDPAKAYLMGEHVSYMGKMYECILSMAAASQTSPDSDATYWKLTDLAAPDATLDVMSDGRLRVVAADGVPLWTQGYALASESAVALSCERINYCSFSAPAAFDSTKAYAVGDQVTYTENDVTKVYQFNTAHVAGAWTGTDVDETPIRQKFTLPQAPSGVVGDFVLDVENTAAFEAEVVLDGVLGTDYDIIVEKGLALSDVLKIPAAADGANALAELYFTMTAFGTPAKPAWRVVRLDVERQGVGS